jgi:hypothetical protein
MSDDSLERKFYFEFFVQSVRPNQSICNRDKKSRTVLSKKIPRKRYERSDLVVHSEWKNLLHFLFKMVGHPEVQWYKVTPLLVGCQYSHFDCFDRFGTCVAFFCRPPWVMIRWKGNFILNFLSRACDQIGPFATEIKIRVRFFFADPHEWWFVGKDFFFWIFCPERTTKSEHLQQR